MASWHGKNARPAATLDPKTTPHTPKLAGFSLHAGRAVSEKDRDGLERLCRYGSRAPFAQERPSLREDDRLVYELSRPWPNSAGVTELVLEPGEVLHRLAALVPGPYANRTLRPAYG